MANLFRISYFGIRIARLRAVDKERKIETYFRIRFYLHTSKLLDVDEDSAIGRIGCWSFKLKLVISKLLSGKRAFNKYEDENHKLEIRYSIAKCF